MRKLNRFWMLMAVVMITGVAYAQDAPPPPPGEHGSGSNQPAGGAPIGSGLFALLGLGAAYGGKKVYHLWKDQQED